MGACWVGDELVSLCDAALREDKGRKLPCPLCNSTYDDGVIVSTAKRRSDEMD